jgi:hypothetical protein
VQLAQACEETNSPLITQLSTKRILAAFLLPHCRARRYSRVSLEPDAIQHRPDFRIRHEQFPDQPGPVVLHHHGADAILAIDARNVAIVFQNTRCSDQEYRADRTPKKSSACAECVGARGDSTLVDGIASTCLPEKHATQDKRTELG